MVRSQTLSTKETVTLKIGDRIVDVPKYLDLPVRTMMVILKEKDPNQQFMLSLEALCEQLEEEDVDVIDGMSASEAVALVTEWMSKSTERGGEEPEIV
jgi:hypothetical protein